MDIKSLASHIYTILKTYRKTDNDFFPLGIYISGVALRIIRPLIT